MKCITTAALAVILVASIDSSRAAKGDQIHAHPGQRVSAGPTKLDFHCTGTGTPTVVFDAGWQDWSPSWALIQSVITRHPRTCTCAIDITLPTAALMLVSILPAALFANGWLSVKLVLLVGHVVLGTLAMKRARTVLARRVFFIAVLGTCACMLGVARMHHPPGWLYG